MTEKEKEEARTEEALKAAKAKNKPKKPSLLLPEEEVGGCCSLLLFSDHNLTLLIYIISGWGDERYQKKTSPGMYSTNQCIYFDLYLGA